jgi:hypothetical protein
MRREGRDTSELANRVRLQEAAHRVMALFEWWEDCPDNGPHWEQRSGGLHEALDDLASALHNEPVKDVHQRYAP